MALKEITLVFFARNHRRDDWKVNLEEQALDAFVQALSGELARYDVVLKKSDNSGITIDINSYADLLNSVRISSPVDGFAAICVGHVIGKSENLNFHEDIRKAVTRIAFAPETVPPEDHNRKVCHNCGCGC